jgi:pimeloyl-ACP methyl ester carboxylesterase
LRRAACHRLPDSGHHCYLEACDHFNRVMLEELAAMKSELSHDC